MGGNLNVAAIKFDFVEERKAIGEAELRNVCNRTVVHLDSQDLGAQTASFTGRAVDLAVVTSPFRSGIVALCLEQFSFDIGDDAFEARGVAKLAAIFVLPLHLNVKVVSIKNCLLNLFIEFVPRCAEFEFEFGGESLHHAGHVWVELALWCRPGKQYSIGNRIVWVAENEVWICALLCAETAALWTSAKWSIERESSRFNLGDCKRVFVWTRHLFAEDTSLLGRVLFIDHVDDDAATGKFQSGFDRIGKSPDDVFLRNQTIDDHRNVVLEGLLQRLSLSKLNHFAIDHRACVSLAEKIFEQVDELAFLLVDDLRENLKSCSLGKLHDLVDDLLRSLFDNSFAALCAVRNADASP